MSLSAVVRSIIPKLTGDLRKGQCGRVGVVGGSIEYTGAPYYSLMSSLRTGADIGHIFCEVQAATPIKSYSPELIVHPVLLSADDLEDALSFEEKAIQCAVTIERWFPSLHSLSIGSGLGRDRLVIDSTLELIRRARSANKPIVLDGDALFALSEGENMQVIQGYKRCILTPNYRELLRLVNCSNEVEGAEKLARNLGNVTVVLKGETDVITNGVETLLCNQSGSPRRCGGQGDILAGAINTFVAWSVNSVGSHNSTESGNSDLPLIDACHAACQLVRHASQAAFQKSKRATTAIEILDQIGPSFYELFDRFLED